MCQGLRNLTIYLMCVCRHGHIATVSRRRILVFTVRRMYERSQFNRPIWLMFQDHDMTLVQAITCSKKIRNFLLPCRRGFPTSWHFRSTQVRPSFYRSMSDQVFLCFFLLCRFLQIIFVTISPYSFKNE